MFGFPIGNGNSGAPDFIEKFTNNADSGFPKSQQREVFYSIKDGNWTDITVWQTASGRVGLLPTANDDVYIKHVISNNNNSTSYAAGSKCNNLFISNTLTLPNAGFIFIHGNIKCEGLLNCTSSPTVYLLGSDNYIKNFNVGTSTIVYASEGLCEILDLPYYNLKIGEFNFSELINRAGTKYLTKNLTITSTLNVWVGQLELGPYDLIVNGTTNISSASGRKSVLSKSAGGNITFVGNVATNSGGVSFYSLDFSGNPNVEFRGGLSMNGMLGNPLNSGTGTFRFTTNNQSISFTTGATQAIFDCVVQIENINLTFGPTGGTATFNNVINGTTPTSTFTNRQVINLVNTTAASGFMTTGIADLTSFANTVQYFGNYSVTIPPHITTYSSLQIGGTGTKTLGVNTTLNGNLILQSNGYLELGLYNLSVNGTTSVGVQNNGQGTLSKTGSGNVLFVGVLNFGINAAGVLNFSVGNPTVELRGGMLITTNHTINTGTSTWTFSTNNQSIGTQNTSGNLLLTFNAPILISGAITLNVIHAVGTISLTLNTTVDGNNISSTFKNSSIVIFNNISTYNIMSTNGVFDNTTVGSIVYYSFNGSIVLPYTSYRGLVINGTGTKTLLGNTTINEVFTLINNSVVDLTTYNLTVNGATQVGVQGLGKGTLLKTGSGNITFVGNLSLGNASNSIIDFSTGNPNVELRGGFTYSSSVTLTSGIGTWTFSTNNQSLNVINSSGFYQYTINASVVISGAITVSVANATAATHEITFNGTINGNNAASKFSNSQAVVYKSATQPMAIGLLDTSTNLNTWTYGLNNQDIKGLPTISPKQVYRNLTLNGTGVKTLQGYVSVLNTYTLTAPATLALNGFTLTNP